MVRRNCQQGDAFLSRDTFDHSMLEQGFNKWPVFFEAGGQIGCRQIMALQAMPDFEVSVRVLDFDHSPIAPSITSERRSYL